MQKERKKIAILFGGCSTEYEVSLQSAYSVIEHLDTEKYEPVMIGLERVTGKWYLYRGGIDQIPEDKWMEQECVPVFPSADRTVHGICYLEGDAVRTISLDAALPVLHGKNGEDGTVQGVFELAGVPVIGCGVLSSALCMDKEISHRIVSDAGIKTARSVLLEENISEKEVKKAAMELGYPVFVKPDRAGSSFGITKVTDEEHLMEAVENAFLHDSIVILRLHGEIHAQDVEDPCPGENQQGEIRRAQRNGEEDIPDAPVLSFRAGRYVPDPGWRYLFQ